MKFGARPLMLLALVTACSPSTQTAAERAAAAARADSSAAGYEVGPSTMPGIATAGPDSTPKGPGSPTRSGPDSAASGQPARSALEPPQPDSVKISGNAMGSTSNPANGLGGSRGSGAPGSPTGGGSPREIPAFPPLDPALEHNYIAYDTARKTVTFQLAAGDEIRDQVSFNGAQRGGRSFTVPLGWRVTIAFANRDPDLPHSATIVDVSGAVPEELPPPVFPRAHTVRMAEGLLEGDADEVLFTADRVGRYLIACGVLGHAQRGQWITLDVSTTATTPTYR